MADHLRLELNKIRKDPSDIEAIHDARVGARRLLAAGDLHAEDSPEWERLRTRLPKLVRRLGRVRNLDVAVDLLRKGKASDRKARGALSKVLKRSRKKERTRLEDWLDRKRIRKIRDEIQSALRAVRQTGRGRTAAPMDLSPFFSRILMLYSDHAWSTDTKAAHHVRQEVRLLRYAYETLEWAYPPEEFKGARSQLRRVQQMAGDWHDRTMLEELAEEAGREGKISVVLDPLIVRVRAESREFIRKFVKATAKLIHLRSQIEGNHE